MARCNRAITARREPKNDLLISILDRFEESHEFTDLAERTRKDYRRQLIVIEAEFGDFPIAAPTDRRTRGEFLAWRERLTIKSRRQADNAFAVLARSLSWEHNRGLVPVNPCERPGRLYRSSRSDSVWTLASRRRLGPRTCSPNPSRTAQRPVRAARVMADVSNPTEIALDDNTCLVICELATWQDELRPYARDVARDLDMPVPTLHQILKTLVAAGHVTYGPVYRLDDRLVSGSSYWLTERGVRLRESLQVRT